MADTSIRQIVQWREGLGDVGPANDYVDFDYPADIAGLCRAVNAVFENVGSEMRVKDGNGVILPTTANP